MIIIIFIFKMDIEIENKIIKIQKWFRGYILRLKRLPLILYQIQK